MTAPTREQVEEWVRDAGLDWHKGFISDDCPLNRYEALISLAFSAGQSGQASGSGAKLVREIEHMAQSTCHGSVLLLHEITVARNLVAHQHWPRLRAALIAWDAAREDAARLDFYEKNPNMIGYATGYRGSVSEWYSRKDGYVTDAPTLREAIDRARGGGDA